MDPHPTLLLLPQHPHHLPSCPPSLPTTTNSSLVFHPSLFHAPSIPPSFVWPEAQAQSQSHPNILSSDDSIQVPTIDLSCFRNSLTPHVVPAHIAQELSQACKTVGFFHVVNHGVDVSLIDAAHELSRKFFGLPLQTKQRANRMVGESFGYASSFTGRFSSRLPWKETFSLQPTPESNITTYFQRVLGNDHEESSSVYETYCQAMVKLGLEIIELLALGLGLERTALTEFFEDNSSILRLNYYPPCQQPSLTYGTGPHTDPTGLTILHQDEVRGLQVFQNGKWYTVSPRKDAFVINIGDTLMALTNKQYKSCLHRAVVNSEIPRMSLTFFLNPGLNTVLSPPKKLLDAENPRAYLDFTWAKFLHFTQAIRRSEVNTLDEFNKWLASATA